MASLGSGASLEEGKIGVIHRDEIIETAGRLGLTPQVVEKDYALGWFLAGIHQHKKFGKTWVFKGGTCLKKCYFETYRFSEDLDFTVQNDKTTPNAEILKNEFGEVAAWIEENSGLEIPRETIEFEVFNNPRGTVSVQGKAAYRGPVRPGVNARSLPRIKIDLTLDEPVLLPTVTRKIDHSYSDLPAASIEALAYAYEEVFAEKTRALIQRLRPRDLYDVIHLFRRKDLNPDRQLVHDTLTQKCALREIPYPTAEAVRTHENRKFVESEWETMLSHQVSTLPPFEQFFDELPQVFDWLRGEVVPELPTLAIEEEEGVGIEAPALLVPSIGASNIDKIRFAAANRLRLRLTYQGSVREIEPYSLARSSEGNLLLQAIKSQTREPRSYRFDRMQGIEVTKTPFTPYYTIEITSSGHLPVHQLTRSAPQRSSTSYRTRSGGGPTYIFQCSRCGKQFRRKTHDSTMKEHKDRNGRTCYGGYGRYLRTEY